ncbi:MAG: hypothetical protein JWL85_94 [Candidatus Saccharibacteria bacterium]|nr:hypothetical protein [Candidatus Saccharibacteria bacterium]
MKANQKGFSVVEVLVVIVVVGLLGVVGWLVYDRQNNKPVAESVSQRKDQVTASNKQEEITIPSDWQWFTSKDKSTKFAYPKAWGNLVEKIDVSQDTYDTNSFVGRVSVSSKKDFLTQLLKGYVDYIWYKWNEDSDTLASAKDTNPPSNYDASYVKPVALGGLEAIEPIYKETKGRAIYEVIGKGAMNCGVHHYFFSVEDKVVHIPATLCTRDGEWQPQKGQAYEDEVATPIKDFYKYIED